MTTVLPTSVSACSNFFRRCCRTKAGKTTICSKQWARMTLHRTPLVVILRATVFVRILRPSRSHRHRSCGPHRAHAQGRENKPYTILGKVSWEASCHAGAAQAAACLGEIGRKLVFSAKFGAWAPVGPGGGPRRTAQWARPLPKSNQSSWKRCFTCAAVLAC